MSASDRVATAAPLHRMVWAQAVMELRLTARRGENLLVTLIIPLALLVFLGSVPLFGEPAEGRAGSVLPGILAIAVIAAGLVNLGISTAYERSYGVLKRLGGTPLPRGGLVAAKLIGIAVLEAVQLVLLLGTAALVLGWAPGPGAGAPVIVAALLLGTGTFAGLGLLMAGTLRAEATLAGANALFLAFLLLGGAIVPIERLPGILNDLAGVLPSSALTEAFRIGLGASAADSVGPLTTLAVWAAATTLLAARTFRWE